MFNIHLRKKQYISSLSSGKREHIFAFPNVLSAVYLQKAKSTCSLSGNISDMFSFQNGLF